MDNSTGMKLIGNIIVSCTAIIL